MLLCWFWLAYSFSSQKVWLAQSQGLFWYSYSHNGKEAGGAWEVGRWHSQDRLPQLTKVIFQTIWHHAQYIKWREGRGTGGCLEWCSLSSQVTVAHDGGLAPLEMAEHLLPHGKQWINSLFGCEVLGCWLGLKHISFLLNITAPLTYYSIKLNTKY